MLDFLFSVLQNYMVFSYRQKAHIYLHGIYKMQNQEVCNLMYSLPDFDYFLDELT